MHTKEEVIAGRLHGLKDFDSIDVKIGRENFINEIIRYYEDDAAVDAWTLVDIAVKKALLKNGMPESNVKIAWNLDEALTSDDIDLIKRSLGIKYRYTHSLRRKKSSTFIRRERVVLKRVADAAEWYRETECCGHADVDGVATA